MGCFSWWCHVNRLRYREILDRQSSSIRRQDEYVVTTPRGRGYARFDKEKASPIKFPEFLSCTRNLTSRWGVRLLELR